MRSLDVLEQTKLLRAIGPAQASNEPYVAMVQMAAMVTAIDGAPIPTPRNELQIDSLIGRLGNDGFAALMVDMQRKIAKVREDAEAAADAAMQNGTQPDPLARSA